jgi:hypothetical protein
MLQLDHIGAQIGDRFTAQRLNDFQLALPLALQLRNGNCAGIKKRF